MKYPLKTPKSHFPSPKTSKMFFAGLAAIASLGLSAGAHADGRSPGSLLLYPEFDNREGDVTVLTVTNVDSAEIDVEFMYIGVEGNNGPVNCEEFNRTETLTGMDTLTLLTRYHNPQQERGYAYVFAKEDGAPVVHNGLIGSLLVINGIENFDYSINPVSFEGLGLDNGNGLRDLDGTEYEGAPGEILIPRFFGQGLSFASELILIGLTGGAAFHTTVDFAIYNDNEEMFSAEHTFHCWQKAKLLDISGVFANDFLKMNTNHDNDEILGASNYESGWFSLHGHMANSPTTTISSPAVYAVLVEEANSIGVSDLPFEAGQNFSGALLARSNDGTF